MDAGHQPSQSPDLAANGKLAPAEVECAVCLQVLLDPVVAPCGHDMCKACYVKWSLASSRGCAHCPICRAPLPGNLGVCVRLKRLVEQLEPAATKRRRLEQDASDEGLKSQGNSFCGYGCGYTRGAPGHQDMQYHLSMAAMYAQYQQWGMYWTSGQQSAVTGTPVADIVQHQLRLRQHTATAALAAPSAITPSATSAPAAPVDSANQQPSTADASRLPCRWQSVADVPSRLACAREILALICARSLASAAHGPAPAQPPLSPATLAAVRAVEVALYRSASSRAEYLDRSTLPARVTNYIRRRAARAAATPAPAPAPQQSGAAMSVAPAPPAVTPTAL